MSIFWRRVYTSSSIVQGPCPPRSMTCVNAIYDARRSRREWARRCSARNTSVNPCISSMRIAPSSSIPYPSHLSRGIETFHPSLHNHPSKLAASTTKAPIPSISAHHSFQFLSLSPSPSTPFVTSHPRTRTIFPPFLIPNVAPFPLSPELSSTHAVSSLAAHNALLAGSGANTKSSNKTHEPTSSVVNKSPIHLKTVQKRQRDSSKIQSACVLS